MRLGYVILYVRDVEASLSFYERAFGLERRFVAEGGEYGELETGGTALGFVSEALVAPLGSRRLRPDEAPPGVEVGLVTDDVAEAVARAVA
ncbi:MAG TPA: VOC family protein, partial [Myxococcota bacterium]|nr:VOC family protein [Myxococcota bacterium]